MKKHEIAQKVQEITGIRMLLEAIQEDRLQPGGKFTDWSQALNEMPDIVAKPPIQEPVNMAIRYYGDARQRIIRQLQSEIQELEALIPKEHRRYK